MGIVRHSVLDSLFHMFYRFFASDPHRVLNLKQGATKQEIKAAYVKLSKQVIKSG